MTVHKIINNDIGTYSTKKGFILIGTTGCSCCRCNNFCSGIFSTKEEAQKEKEYHIRNKTCASQYSRTGNYDIKEVSYNLLSDDRIIIGGRVFESSTFEETGEESTNIGY